MPQPNKKQRREFIPLPSQASLKKLFDYDEQTGVLTWKNLQHNRTKPSKKAGCVVADGSIRIKLNGDYFKAHRLIWMLLYNEDPGPRTIDHRNEDLGDNRRSNLRIHNGPKQSKKHRNSKGYAFIKSKKINQYGARIRINGRLTHIGFFPTAEEASAAYQQRCREVYGDYYSGKEVAA